MATIVTRVGKGSPLTFTELDSNFTNLNTEKLERNGSIAMTGNLNLNSNSITNANTITTTGNVGVGTTNIGTAGLSLSQSFNLAWEQSATESIANIFRQSSSVATVIANGYKRSATANGFASGYSTSWAKTAISLGTVAGAITFYADAAAAVAVGTDVTPTEQMRLTTTGLGISQGNAPTQAFNVYRSGSTATYMAAGNSNTGLDGTWFGVDTAGNAVINQRQALATIFSTTNTERMRIAAAGNITISAPSSGTALAINSVNTTTPYVNYVTGGTTTVGAAGGASALPATPVGYVTIAVGGTNYKMPYYNT
jgi:hypothetical protein